MKTLHTLILMLCFSAFAKAEPATHNPGLNKSNTSAKVADMSWTGTFDTTFGQIILLQKGNHVVGTYRDLGPIRSTSIKGGVMELEFENGKNKGVATFVRTVNGFTGYWGWGTKKDKGAWNGTKVKDAPQNYIKGLWKTTYQDLEFIDSKTGIMVAHYGNNGGMLWGKMNHITDIFEGFYTQRAGARVETCWFYFYNKKFEGKFNNRPRGSWNGWRPGEATPNTNRVGQAVTTTSTNTVPTTYRIKMTLNEFLCHKSDNRIRKREKAYVGFRNRLTIDGNKQDYHKRENIGREARWLNDRTWNQWYHKGFIQEYAEGVRHNVNAYFVYNIPQRHLDAGIELVNGFVFKENLTAIGRSDFNLSRAVNIKEVIKLLTGQTRPSQYTASTNGMFKLPNSPEHYKLITQGNTKYVKVYGDLIDPDRGVIKFGYHYTIQLVN